MSGIVAVVNFDEGPIDRALLQRMVDGLAFRGPDAQHLSIVGSAGLGQTFLRIDDGGRVREMAQPFTVDSRIWIVADARIDARRDLLAQMSAAGGEVGADASDSELILRAYHLWGEDCVSRLLGDFMFAIWDAPRRRFFGARDHLGIKPFFFATCGASVIVSNTLDCVRLHPAVSRELHDPAIADFLLFGANQDVTTTVFRDVHRLPPAHCVSWTRDAVRRRCYWTLPVDDPIHFRRAADYADRFHELVVESVRDRLRSRRAAVLMSGGVDSPALAAIAQRVLRQDSLPCRLDAITSVYDRLIPDHERRYAALVADHLKIPIRYDVRDDETSIKDWDRVQIKTPEPVENPPAFAAGLEFMRKIADDRPVLLYGEGPDNALRYEWRPYLAHLARRRQLGPLARAVASDLMMHRRLPWRSAVRRLVPRSDEGRSEPWPDWLNPAFADQHRCRERWDAVHERINSATKGHPTRPIGHHSFSDVRWQSLFEYSDALGAAGHAGMRFPYLDLRVLRYLLAVPPMPWCRHKLIIRRAMQTALPRDVLRRPKAGMLGDPDFERVKRSGFPILVPASDLAKYVRPDKIPVAPRTAAELRSALRPLGLNAWLEGLNRP
jgi:asparagine synthase (glutamine-hydrolysing)